MNASALAKNLNRVLDRLERGEDEMIVITRKDHAVAKLLPEAPHMTALQAMGDLFGVLSKEEGRAWVKDTAAINRRAKGRMRDPWAS